MRDAVVPERHPARERGGQVTRAELIAEYRRIGRLLADERTSDAEHERLRLERDAVQLRLDAMMGPDTKAVTT